jgi:hypothetical protein
VTAVRTAGTVVAVVCATVFLTFGVAVYRGRNKRLTDVWMLGPTEKLAPAWLGGGALLVMAGAAPLTGEAPPLVELLAVALGVLGGAAWFVGLVALFWLPRALRPRWFDARRRLDPGRMYWTRRSPWHDGSARTRRARPRRRRRATR